LNVVIDFLDQFLHAAKGPAANGLLRDAVEPDLHLVEPGGIGRSEVHMESWPSGEPAFDSRVFVRGVVVHDDVHLQVLRHVGETEFVNGLTQRRSPVREDGAGLVRFETTPEPRQGSVLRGS